MTYNYQPLQATAERLIRRFGRPVTLRKKNSATGNPWEADTDGASSTIQAVDTKFSTMERMGTLVQNGDLKLLVSTEGNPAPELSDTVIDGEDIFQVVSVERLAPGPTNMLWYLHVRQ